MNRSQGALALARLGLSQEVIAEACSVSRVAVAHWQAGRKKPLPPKRSILNQHFGIPEASWDSEIGSTPEAKPEPKPIPEGVRGKALALEAMAHELLAKANADAQTTGIEKARIMASIASTLRLLSRITGESENPFVEQVTELIGTTLAPHPEAAAAVAVALERLAEKRRN